MTPPPASVRCLSSYQRPSRPWGRSWTLSLWAHPACRHWRGAWGGWGRWRRRLYLRSTHCSSYRPSTGRSTPPHELLPLQTLNSNFFSLPTFEYLTLFLILPSLTLFSEPYSCSLTQHFTSSFILRSFFPWTFSVFLSHWKHTGGQRGAQFLHLFTRRPEEMGPEGLSLCEWQLYLLISSCPQKQCQAILWTHF